MTRTNFIFYIFITVLTLLLTVNSTAESTIDKREELFLGDDDIDYLAREMQRFLYAIQQVTEGMENNDMKQIIYAAKSIGTSSVQQVPGDLKSSLPSDFKKLGYATRQTFDQLAMDAEQFADKEHTLSQLNQVLSLCTDCHSRYKVE